MPSGSSAAAAAASEEDGEGLRQVAADRAVVIDEQLVEEIRSLSTAGS